MHAKKDHTHIAVWVKIVIFGMLIGSSAYCDNGAGEEADAKVMESMFDLKGKEGAKDIFSAVETKEDNRSSGETNLLEDMNLENEEAPRKKPSIAKAGMGKSLSEEEINKSLLTFSREEELRKQKIQEERKREEKQTVILKKEIERLRAKIEKEKLLAQTNYAADKPNVVVSIEEQKRMLESGPLVPSAEIGTGQKGSAATIGTTAIFYGTSCVDGQCVAIGADKSYSVGDTIGDSVAGSSKKTGEKETIISISREAVKTNKRVFDFAAPASSSNLKK